MSEHATDGEMHAIAQREYMEKIAPHLRPGAKQRRVVCAANRNRETREVVIGPRHLDPTMRGQITACVDSAVMVRGLGDYEDIATSWRTAEQGFIDQWGQFMDRKEAFQVAKAAGHLLYGPHLPDEFLDSSDLY